jgi:uncharacterized membrane protein YjjP (DUF1212 family)
MTRPLDRPGSPNSLRRVFRWPILIAAASIAGLLSALIGDGWADMLSWALLGGLVIVMAVAWRRGA